MTRGGDYLHLRYVDFMKAVGYYAGWGRNNAVGGAWDIEDRREILHDIVNSGCRQFYFPPPISADQPQYGWGFLKPTRTIQIYAAVSTTLAADPSLAGDQITIQAASDVFESTMVGSPIEFTTSKQRFTISEYLSSNRVNVSQVDDDGEDTSVSNYVSGSLAEPPGFGTGSTVSSTDISDSTNTPFTVDMIGDLINFSGTTYPIIQFISSTKIRVQGDASGESGAFTVDRSATVSDITTLRGSGSTIETTSPTFRADMATDGDTMTFTATGTPYTIATYAKTNSATLSTNASVESESDTITISKDGTTSAVSAVYAASSVRSTNNIFTSSHVDMYIAFEDSLNAYQIVSVFAENKVSVSGDASNETGDFGIVYQVGASSALSYASPETTVTASSGIFTATVSPVGKYLHFKKGTKKYPVSSRSNDTEVALSGNAAGEAADDDIWLAGATTQNDGDAFLVSDSGGTVEMPNEFAGSIIGDITFDPSTGAPPIRIIGESQIRELRQRNTLTGRPRFAAIRPKAEYLSFSRRYGPTFTEFNGQIFEMLLEPAPDKTYNISFQFNAAPLSIGDDYPTPLGGTMHGETILASCLAEAERRLNDERGEKWEMFMERLSASIEVDKSSMRPEYLGYNSDGTYLFGGRDRMHWRDAYIPSVTYNGDTL